MRKWFYTLFAAANIIAMPTAYGDMRAPPEPSVSAQFETGQVWTYKTRPKEVGSRVIIGKIEKAPMIGIIVHAKIIGLHMKNPRPAKGPLPEIGHTPITESALKKSVITLTDEVPNLEGFAEGYEAWLSAYQNTGGGVFTLSLSEVVDAIEHVFNEPDHVTGQEEK